MAGGRLSPGIELGPRALASLCLSLSSPPDRWSLTLAGSEYQVLYIADDNEIRSLFPGHPHSAYEQAFQGDESVRIDAMDVHVKAGRVYWTNWHTGTISYRSLPPAAPPTTSNRHRRQLDRGVTHLNVSAQPVRLGGSWRSLSGWPVRDSQEELSAVGPATWQQGTPGQTDPRIPACHSMSVLANLLSYLGPHVINKMNHTYPRFT